MAEESSSGRTSTEVQKELLDSDMAAAAELLMQLSGGEEDEDCNVGDKTNKSNRTENRHQGEVTSRKKKRDEESTPRPKKQKYVPIDHIYMVTRPLIGVMNGEDVKNMKNPNLVLGG